MKHRFFFVLASLVATSACGAGGGTATTSTGSHAGGAHGTGGSQGGSGGATTSSTLTGTSVTTSTGSTGTGGATTSTSTGSGGATTSTSTGSGGATSSTSTGSGGATTSTTSSVGGAGGATSSCAGTLVPCNGTCVDAQTDDANCGACGTTCTGGKSCVAGSCSCTGTQTDCGGSCVDPQSDPAHCGGCGKPCATNWVCNAGQCALTCNSGLTPCNGACVDVQTDTGNCGGCGTVCPKPANASPTCNAGSCAFQCSGAHADCNGAAGDGCEIDTATNASHCGSCNHACPGGANATGVCVGGSCALACASGFADCDGDPANGCETDLGSIASCGGCGNACAAGANAIPLCVGTCTYTCVPGFLDCDGDATNGCEIDGQTDPLHCGSCAGACSTPAHAAATCAAGACGYACDAGYLDCDGSAANGCEIDGQTDPLHCGSCAGACSVPNATAGCANGACTVATCDFGFLDCSGGAADGCESDITSDPSNCGGCGYACDGLNVSLAQCLGGVCAPVCAAPFGDCNGPAIGNADDGCEVNLATDVNNCGTCGTQCAAGSKCCGANGCQDTTNCALSIASVTATHGWQNGGDWVTITGTGFAAGVKVFFHDGLAPAWAKDAQTIIVQTPPHPVGLVDVKVVQGADTAISHGAFQYLAKGLMPPWQKRTMAKVRGEIPGLAVLQDGRVLVAGGTTVADQPGNSLNTVELLDPVTNVVSYGSNSMSTYRWRNSVITMLTGKALLTGGCGGCAGGNAASADLFDPTTNLISPAAPLNTARNDIHAVLMGDGRVFVSSANAATVELYNPITNTWKQIAHTQTHPYGFVVRLRDGRVMLGGGDGGIKVVELFDPWTETFTLTGSLNTGRSMLTAHTLPDSRVIVIGGTNVSAGGVNAPQVTMEVWNPTTGLWTYTPKSLGTPRCWHASALVRDGTILVMGGYPTTGSCTPTASVEQVDPVAGTVTVFAQPSRANTEWVATTLLDGSVIAVGGGACGSGTALEDMDFLQGAQ